MNEYKIEVTNEAESKEAQELFFEMGYAWLSGGKSVQHTKNGYLFISENYRITFAPEHYLEYFNTSPHQQITLPELRTLTLLKRNDENDATHVDEDGDKWFMCGDDNYILDSYDGWIKSDKEIAEYHNVKPIQKKESEMSNLISGKEAKLAWANGQEVQLRHNLNNEWQDLDNEHNLYVFDVSELEFRLKPQTITLTLELPKPFKPDVGDIYWFIYPDVSEGYSFETCENDLGDKNLTQFGAYRTEEEVKQVVEALRAAALEALNA